MDISLIPIREEKLRSFDDYMSSKKEAFTLAEVLITLAIIGVVAAITIPSVIVKTKNRELITGAKKAFSVISSATQLAEIQTGMFVNDGNCWDSGELEAREAYSDAFEKNLNIIKTAEEIWGNRTLYLADGSKIFYNYGYPCYIYVDVNGEKGPTNSESYDFPDAKFNDWDDLYEQDWPNVQLTDIFVVEFKADGTSSIAPYSYGGPG